MKIFVFGNPLLREDAVSLRILPHLERKFPQIEFFLCDPNEDWLGQEKEIILMDTVLGIKKVTLFNSLKNFAGRERKMSLHDYDLLSELRLLQKIGRVKGVKIIGLPSKLDFQKLLAQTEELLRDILKLKST